MKWSNFAGEKNMMTNLAPFSVFKKRIQISNDRKCSKHFSCSLDKDLTDVHPIVHNSGVIPYAFNIDN